MRARLTNVSYIRSLVFGVEDGLVSTVGLLSGVAIAGMERQVIFLTGLVLIFVEAFSMAVGSFLSEESAEEYAVHHEVSTREPLKDGIIMFFSYFVSGLVPLAPYIFLPVKIAFALSVGLSLAVLFILGIFGAKISKINIWRHGLRMMALGGAAIIVGIVVGQIAK